MSDYQFYGYAPDAIVFDESSGSYTLDANYDAAQDRNRFEVSDNDDMLDGDGHGNSEKAWDEKGEDRDQNGQAFDADGNQIASGKIYVEEILLLEAADGSTIELHRLEIDGELVGYVPSEPLQPGVSYSVADTHDVDDDHAAGDTRESYEFYQGASVPCFGPGTMIMTQGGEIPVEWLETSDRVLTRDHAYQPILWIGRTKLPRGHFAHFPQDIPVRIPAGSLGNRLPTHDLEVTGDHRLLLRSVAAELMFSSAEVFAPAKAWAAAGEASRAVPDRPYKLTHILCASHEVIMANGAWVESMFPGPETLRRLSPADRARVIALLGPEYNELRTARLCLTCQEAIALLRAQRAPARAILPERQARIA